MWLTEIAVYFVLTLKLMNHIGMKSVSVYLLHLSFSAFDCVFEKRGVLRANCVTRAVFYTVNAVSKVAYMKMSALCFSYMTSRLLCLAGRLTSPYQAQTSSCIFNIICMLLSMSAVLNVLTVTDHLVNSVSGHGPPRRVLGQKFF